MNLGNNNVGLIQMRKTVIFQQLYIFQKLDGHALIVQDFALSRSSWQLNRYTSKNISKEFPCENKAQTSFRQLASKSVARQSVLFVCSPTTSYYFQNLLGVVTKQCFQRKFQQFQAELQYTKFYWLYDCMQSISNIG